MRRHEYTEIAWFAVTIAIALYGIFSEVKP